MVDNIGGVDKSTEHNFLSQIELLRARITAASCVVPGHESFPNPPLKRDIFKICRTALLSQFSASCQGLEGDVISFRRAIGNYMVQCCSQYPEVCYRLAHPYNIPPFKHTNICIYIYIYIYICMRVRVRARACACVRACVHVCHGCTFVYYKFTGI